MTEHRHEQSDLVVGSLYVEPSVNSNLASLTHLLLAHPHNLHVARAGAGGGGFGVLRVVLLIQHSTFQPLMIENDKLRYTSKARVG